MIQSNETMVVLFSFILVVHSLIVEPLTPHPMLGDLTATSVKLFAKNPSSKTVTVSLRGTDHSITAERSIVQFKNLTPNTTYTYAINGEHKESWWFKTRPEDDTSARIAFGSCANEKEGSSKVWNRMNEVGIDALVLLGDTPYIDTTDLAVQRRRYQEFAAVPAFAKLVAHTPVYSTWDDHDFGRNDTDGNLEGKENSRKAFSEHRPNPSVGENDQGIYTSFKKGPVEVFLLDARWFARTERSENNIPTLLGAQQWEWLERELKASTSPYKILASGMIFNGATRPGKTDHWGEYPTEYFRLLSIIKRESISGVVLVSGDIHWSRVINHNTKSKIGYDLIEFVTSPIHEKLISAANASHEGDVFSVGEINSYLLLHATTVDEKLTLTMNITNASGEALFTYSFSDDQ
jgi:alkaline phosphatase D